MQKISDSAFKNNEIGGDSDYLIPRRKNVNSSNIMNSAFLPGTVILKTDTVSNFFKFYLLNKTKSYDIMHRDRLWDKVGKYDIFYLISNKHPFSTTSFSDIQMSKFIKFNNRKI